MATKVVVHSDTKRLIQVVGLALLIAAALTGLKKLAAWWKAPVESNHPAVISSSASLTGLSEIVQSERDLITGLGSVVDGDTIQIDGQHIRLDGIDAPEASQLCKLADQEWACGRQAAIALTGWLQERPISCAVKGKDRYGRTLARCFVGTDDIQSWLVINGWALAFQEYSKDFVAAEKIAKARRVGMWQGEFIAPWDWRAERRKVREQQP